MDISTVSGGLALGGLAAGLLASAWSYVQLVLKRLVGLVIVTASTDGAVSVAVASYCWTNLKRSPTGARKYSNWHVFVRPVRRRQVVAYEELGCEPVLFWRGWRPLFVGVGSPNDAAGSTTAGGPPSGSGSLRLTFLRWTWDVDKLIRESVDRFNERQQHLEIAGREQRRYRINHCAGMGRRSNRNAPSGDKPAIARTVNDDGPRITEPNMRLLRWQMEELGPELVVGGKALDFLAFPPEVRQLVGEIEHWKNSEEWYRQRHIPWRRGWLIQGKPGTGKTSLVRAVAQDLDLPVFVFDTGSMNNDEFRGFWRSMLDSSVPAIALLEDLDVVFNGRVNILGEDGGGLSFDCLLNCISGIEASDGIFLVITTNRPEVLDEALGISRGADTGSASTRPGRVDRVLVLREMTEDSRRELAARILTDCPEFVEKLVAEGDGDTPAQFQDRCALVALQEFWRRQEFFSRQNGERDGREQTAAAAEDPQAAGAVSDDQDVPGCRPGPRHRDRVAYARRHPVPAQGAGRDLFSAS